MADIGHYKQRLIDFCKRLTWQKTVYAIQAGFAITLYYLLYLLPVRWASAIGGWCGRNILYYLPLSKIAFKNLQAVYPDKPQDWYNQTVKSSLDNLGRTFFEIPHINKLEMGTDITVKGAEILNHLQKNQQTALFFSAHFGNWEVLAKVSKSLSMPFQRVYRKANNPYIERFIQKRPGAESGGFIPKGKEGSKLLMRAIKNKQHIGMLLDQKMNNGIESRFLGRMAMSADAPALLARKHGMQLIPAYTLRTYSPKGQPQFIVHILPPLEQSEDTSATVHNINKIMEKFIDEYPEQWMWVHRRFRDVNYRGK